MNKDLCMTKGAMRDIVVSQKLSNGLLMVNKLNRRTLPTSLPKPGSNPPKESSG